MIAALRICGAVFVPMRPDIFGEGVQFTSWHRLWKEALEDLQTFWQRSIVRARRLRFSKGEDLLRTRIGESKTHTADIRYNFGVGQDVLASPGWSAWVLTIRLCSVWLFANTNCYSHAIICVNPSQHIFRSWS